MKTAELLSLKHTHQLKSNANKARYMFTQTYRVNEYNNCPKLFTSYIVWQTV